MSDKGIDLGADLDGYDDEDTPTPPWPPPADARLFTDEVPHGASHHSVGMGMPRSIGKLTDLQRQGFNTMEPPAWRALKAIKKVSLLVDKLLLDNTIGDEHA